MPDTLQPRHHHAVEAAKAARAERAAAAAALNGQDPALVGDTVMPPAGTPPAAPLPTSDGAAPALLGVPVIDPVPQKSQREIQLEQELARAAARAAELEGAVAAITSAQAAERAQRDTELAELRAYQSRVEMDKLVSFDGVELETLDPAAVQELGAKVLRPLTERLSAQFEDRLNKTREELATERAARERLQAEQSETQLNQQRRALNDRIFKAHPDFEKIKESPEFAAWSGQTIRQGSGLTMGALLANEYHNGNADFVIQAVAEFKQGRPSLEHIAGAPTVGTGTVPAAESQQPQYTMEDVAEWNKQRARGEITTEQFKKLRAQYAAQKNAAQAVT